MKRSSLMYIIGETFVQNILLLIWGNEWGLINKHVMSYRSLINKRDPKSSNQIKTLAQERKKRKKEEKNWKKKETLSQQFYVKVGAVGRVNDTFFFLLLLSFTTLVHTPVRFYCSKKELVHRRAFLFIRARANVRGYNSSRMLHIIWV